VTIVSRFLPVRSRRGFPTWRLALAATVLSMAAWAQESEVYNARLSRFPVIGGTPAGIGSATATLSGTTLEVSGSFEGLTFRAGRGGGDPAASPAREAGLHTGPLTAVAGEHLFDLTLEPAPEGGVSGTISGSVELTPEQVELLREGRIYAQIDSEAAPDGHLWGWFLQ